jgi:hypothetical protein
MVLLWLSSEKAFMVCGLLANLQLKKHLAAHDYHPVTHTAGLYKHRTRPITFSLCVDDFEVKYVGKEHAQHLEQVLRQKYRITTDWTGSLYVGLTLNWNYKARTVDLSMPGYVAKALERFQHPPPTRPQHSPHDWQAPQYGTKTQLTDPADLSPPLPPSGIQFLQQVIGTLLYYARAIDNTMLVAIGSIASAQNNGTEATMQEVTHLLNYCATHPNAVIRFKASDMVLHIHSDASYLSASQARSRIGGYFFLSVKPVDRQTPPAPDSTPPPFNGPVHVNSTILKSVMASAAEAKLGAVFYNAKDGAMLRTILEELGYPQPATPIQTDNICASGIANDTVKQRRLKAMDMRFYRVKDRIKKDSLWFIGEKEVKMIRSKAIDGDRYTFLLGQRPHQKRTVYGLLEKRK